MAEAIPPTSPDQVNELLGTAGAPPDNLGGATIPVTGGVGDLHNAINGLGAFAGQGALNTDGSHKGNTYEVPVGVDYTAPTLPIATTGWTCIRTQSGSLPARGTRVTAANAAAMFKIRSPAGATFDNPTTVWTIGDTRGWRIIGLDIAHGSAVRHNQIVVDAGRRMLWERCYLHHYPNQSLTGRGMRIHGGDWQMWDSCLDTMHAWDAETQCLWYNMYQNFASQPTYARMHLENTKFEGAGENVLLGDQFQLEPCRHVTIKRCDFPHPQAWRQFLDDGSPNPSWDNGDAGRQWNVKNNFEIKWVFNLLFEGNILDGNWPQGQDGTALVISSGTIQDGGAFRDFHNEDVMVRSNIIRHVTAAWNVFTLGGSAAARVPNNRIAIVNNLCLDVRTAVGAENRLAFINWEGHNVRIEHNTEIHGALGGSSPSLYINANTTTVPNLTVRRNAWSRGTSFKITSPAGTQPNTDAGFDTVAPTRVFAENAQFGPGSNPAVTGFTFYDSAAAAGIDEATGILTPTSPLAFGQVGYVGTDEQDIGVNHDVLNAAIGGTPSVPVASFSAQLIPGTFGVNFIDTSSGIPTSGTWTFGDGGSSNLLSHNRYDYAAPGTYTVTHTVQNALGSDSVTQDVVVVLEFGFVRGAVATVGAGQTTVPIQVAQINVGDLVIVSLNRCDAPSIDSMDDTLGNVYSALSGQFSPILGGAYKSRTFYTVATAGGFNPVITGRLSGPTETFARILYREYACPNPIGLVGSNLSPPTTSGTPMNSGNVTVSKANSLLIGYHDFDFVSTPTMPAGWTLRDERFTADRINVAAGTYAFQPTFTGTQGWVAQIAAFEFDAEAPTQVDVAGADTL